MIPLFIISCPIDTYSGYGARSRDLAKAIIQLDKYNVKILPQRWGNCPWNFIKDHPEEWSFLTPHLLPVGNQLPSRPDIWAQVTVPNEFQPVGKYNIGFTAGIETTLCAPQWIEGLNRMDINFVSSQHAKQTFINSRFNTQDKNGNSAGALELKKPVEVLFEGANIEQYFPKNSEFDLNQIEENFAYLFVGHWMQGIVGEDRKNTGGMLQCFFEAFKNKKKTPALILKTSGAGCSIMDREQILDRINQIKNFVPDARTLPNVYLLHGELSDKEMNELYNHKKVKAMVSLTKGEGFGRPLLEFSLTKKPIITTNWSGHTDFLDPEFTTLIGGKLTNVHSSAILKDMILQEAQWFTADYNEYIHVLRDMFKNYKPYKEKAVRQAYKSKTEFSFEEMSKVISAYTDTFPEFPQEVKLNLPEPDIALPSLKKI